MPSLNDPSTRRAMRSPGGWLPEKIVLLEEMN
jgi:hypothetical protein